jgi:hypothetical protein
MNGSRRVVAAADERELVGQLGVPRQDFAEANLGGTGANRLERPADLGGRLGFRIERVDLARRPEVENHDAGPVVLRVPFRTGRFASWAGLPAVAGGVFRRRLGRQQLR